MEMTHVPNAWELASLACKFLFYLAASASLGSGVCLCLYNDGSRKMVHKLMVYQLIGGLLGFQVVLINFLVQVGLANGAGLGGAFDMFMAEILLDTPLGDLSLVRLAGFSLIIANSVFFLWRLSQMREAPPLRFYRRAFTIVGLGFILLLISFRFGGHVSVLSPVLQLVLALHFTIFAVWIGALYPLFVLSCSSDIAGLQITLRRFGDHAMKFVSVLLIAGVVLTINLIHSPAELYETSYGRALSFKILLVLAILAIAALNNLKLVPALLETAAVRNFKNSLRLEIAVASALLLATAWLSTIVGPTMTH